MDKAIIDVAKQCRKWVENHAKAIDICNDPDLGGWCAIASAHLHDQLVERGFSSRIAYNSHHCFVIVGGHIVDITATQFGERYKKIHVQPLNRKVVRPERWYIGRTFGSVKGLRNYMEREGWPPEQISLEGAQAL
jgi:hypothetical protein